MSLVFRLLLLDFVAKPRICQSGKAQNGRHSSRICFGKTRCTTRCLQRKEPYPPTSLSAFCLCVSGYKHWPFIYSIAPTAFLMALKLQPQISCARLTQNWARKAQQIVSLWSIKSQSRAHSKLGTDMKAHENHKCVDKLPKQNARALISASQKVMLIPK